MKILYVTSLAFRESSSASIRNTSLINGLVEKGCKVDLLTLSYPEKREDNYLKSIVSDKVKIFKSEIPFLNNYLNKNTGTLPVNRNTIYSKIRDIIKNAYFFPDVDKEWISNYNKDVLSNNYDFIISSSDTKTSHYVAQKIIKSGGKNMENVKWVQIWGDPWENDINIKKYMRKKIKQQEKKLLELADYIFYVSEPTMNQMKSKYPKHADKIYYLGRSFIEENRGRKIGETKDWVFTYTGSLNPNRNISNLINAINLYNQDHSKKIELNLYGRIDEKTSKIIEANDKICYHGSVSLTEINQAYQNSDVLIYIDNGGETTQIPGKIYDYLGTDRPILALVETKKAATTVFLQDLNRCELQLNSPDSISFDFLSTLSKMEVNQEYSAASMAEKLLGNIK